MRTPERQALHHLTRPVITALPTYDPGADPEEIRLKYQPKRLVKLSNNENPLGISPLALEALQRRLLEGLGRYPDPAGKALCQALADKHKYPAQQIILGNGSENILELLCQVFLNAKDLVVTQSPCFSLHETFPRMMGATVLKVPLTDRFSCDLEAWRKTLQLPAKLIFISNPCNPSGTVFSAHELQEIVQASPEECLLVLDEAYHEYAEADPAYSEALDILAAQSRPWIVLRTFSKAYGLASLRVGYGIASHPGIIEAMHRVRTPYNVNQLAQEAALAALDDADHLRQSVALITQERVRLTHALEAHGYRVAPSNANFLFIDTHIPATTVVEALLRQGVIVKAWRESGYETFIRASIALPEENDQFLKALLSLKRSI
ncbi:histidinol-phosphate transaminase [Ectopseudomonas mendocina]|uniref:Histidinol-phosphate aminotransferase n=1 Tax=Ectopseudomonas mendocina TaxID=300 RepID=A0ABZ2RAQ3_ECTME